MIASIWKVLEDDMNKAGIIILNYNSWEDTIECINGCSNIKYPHIIIVVDNCSTDESYRQLSERLAPNIILLQTRTNLGYAGGNNVGIDYALKDGCLFICVLNNDTLIQEDFLTPCIEVLNRDPNIGFVGPTLIDYRTGLVQSTGGNVNLKRGLASQINNNKRYEDVPKYVKCDYICGACIICNKKTIEKVGYIPESYFLFFEETEWCYRAAKYGLINICLGDTKIVHKGSVSINKTEGLNGYLMCRNRVAFVRRNLDSRVMAYLFYTSLIWKNIIRFMLGRNDAIMNIKAYYDGWHKKVNTKNFPFIIINE